MVPASYARLNALAMSVVGAIRPSDDSVASSFCACRASSLPCVACSFATNFDRDSSVTVTFRLKGSPRSVETNRSSRGIATGNGSVPPYDVPALRDDGDRFGAVGEDGLDEQPASRPAATTATTTRRMGDSLPGR